MELLKPSSLTKTPLFFPLSSPTTTTSLTSLNKKTHYKFRKTHQNFAKKLPITAQFNRPTNRRNSLRKKLTRDSQVRQTPLKNLDPLPPFVDNDTNLVTKTESVEQFKESILLNKLENWVENYKKDVNFWGIGTNPIFTVFQHITGKVDRVSVDEDEILRRSGCFKEGKQLSGFEELNLKLSHAKFLAKEIECGRYVVPKNSSVVKFVNGVQGSGFVGRIRSVSLLCNIRPKVSRIGVAMVCGFVFVWVVKSLFTVGGNGIEMTSFDNEMLRRKIKSRIEKDNLSKGSVEVVEEPSEITDFSKRPELDREELLNSIRNVKGLNNELAVLDVAGHREIASQDMDAKIQEIQIMARHARKIEEDECSSAEEDESDDQNLSELLLTEEVGIEQVLDTFEIGELKTQASDRRLPTIEMTDHVNSHLNEWSTQPRIVNGVMKDEEPGTSDATFSSENLSYRNEDHIDSNGRILDDKINFMENSVEMLTNANLSDTVEGIQLPVRRKPKVILSVKEAREYLLQKRHQNPQATATPTIASEVNDRTGNQMSQPSKEDRKDSSGVDRSSEPTHSANIFEYNSVKENTYLEVDSNELNAEVHIRSVPNIASDPGVAEHSNSSETSDVLCGNTLYDDSMEKEYLPTEKTLDKVDKMNGLHWHTIVGEVSELVPSKSVSIDAGNSTGPSIIPDDADFHDAHLKKEASFLMEKNLDIDDRIIETPKPGNPSGKSDPILVAYDQHDSSSEENADFSVGKNVEKHFRKNDGEDQFVTGETSLDLDNGNTRGSSVDKEIWLEKNFHEVEPILKRIGVGFRSNYMVAKEKVKGDDIGLDFAKLRSIKDDTELEWMQNDKLREIVFRVKENELAGRDPFHSMDLEDKTAFLKGLESKVEKENAKLSTLHAWLHSNIENIDYGADGISLYDPPDKVVPRWKGPPIDKVAEFLTNPAEQINVASSLQKENDSLQHDEIEISPANSRANEVAKISKTVIEASDGSIKPGKKSGKEHWQHTKKWSRGFLESYNAETDSEVKSTMKDIGNGLDRWITEEEIQDAANLMDKIPQRGKEYIDKKINKLKREMEQFGPAAVVSKYREYGEEKEEDYLWWLDLRYVLCIELYTYEGKDQRVGFYSLEMAAELEIDPKPHHVIAFEDPSDCKNFCCIIQAHLEMLGNGKAFVVAQPPKDVFWQAKENGFGVTVIKKSELQLNADQPLEEVEELITEIGSKMYQDKMTRDRSVDISSLMKGVFGISKLSKRKRKKRVQKKLRKS